MFVEMLREFAPEFVRDQCAFVLQSEPSFRAVHCSKGFRTLGLPRYQSKSGSLEYRDAIRNDSPLLKEVFGPLQRAVAEELQTHLGEAIQTHPRAALPGFHIFSIDPGSSYPGGGPHFDLSHHLLPLLPDECVEQSMALNSCLSFTLPLRLPASGGGLQQWNLSYGEFLRQPRQSLVAYATESPALLTRYEVGKLYVYSGLLLHQIAPIPASNEAQERLTYQGHCVRIDGRWTMFW